MEPENFSRQLFCAREQKISIYKIDIKNNEVIFTCRCGDFIKFPATLTDQEILKHLHEYEAKNSGQVKAVDIPEKELRERMNRLAIGN